MVAWIVLVALVGPHFGAAPTKWTMTGSDGTVQMWGYTRSASRELYLAVAAFAPTIVFVVFWWLQRR